jgi:hypothetical protein
MKAAFDQIRRHPVEFVLLAALFATGAWARLDRLSTTTGFTGDQGEYYLAVMRWAKLGAWPMMGPRRSVTGDHALSPGMYYAIAPALVATGFHPAAGAATQVALVMLGYALAWHWMRRGTRRGWPALLAIGAILLSPNDVAVTRSLWNPYFLIFGTTTLTWLVRQGQRRPVAVLAGVLMLLAWLPACHTTAYVIAAATIPILACATWAWRRRARRARRSTLVAWGLATLAWLALLYVPPLLLALKPGSRSLSQYVANTLHSTPSPLALARRAWLMLDRQDAAYYRHFYIWNSDDAPVARWTLTLLCMALVGRATWLDRRRLARDPSPLLPMAVMLAFYVVGVRSFEDFQDYYLAGAFPAPAMLAGWAAGRLERAERNRDATRRWAVVMAALALFLPAAGLWPATAALPRQLPETIPPIDAIVETIRRDARGEPFSLALLQPIDYPDYLVAMLWRAGMLPRNDPTARVEIHADEFGSRAYVVVRGLARHFRFLFKGLAPGAARASWVGEDCILRIDRSALPPHFKQFRAQCKAPAHVNVLDATQ